MWIEREISKKLENLSKSFPVLILTGARQTGKTSLLKRVFPKYRYVSLDLRLLAEQAEQSPESFLRDYPPPLLIDEVQYAPKLFRHIKVLVDQEREKKGLFILTGSQKFSLMKEVSDSLAGRCALLNLPGLSAKEIISSLSENWSGDLYSELLWRGAFPELWADRSIPVREYYQSYVSTYLERDVREILNVGSLRDFERCLRACATRAAQLLNKSELARDVGVSPTTMNQWVSVLETSNQIKLLEPFFANLGKRLTKSPKLYFCDSGLLCFLLGMTKESVNNSSLIGHIWENFVLNEISKWVDLYHPEWSVWFYRDQQNREADFLVQGPYERIRLLEAKWSEVPEKKHWLNLEQVAAILSQAKEFRELSLALITRTAGVVSQSANRSIVSGVEIENFFKS